MGENKDPIYRLGEVTWILGTLVAAALAIIYAGLPAASYVDELLFGPKPRDPGNFSIFSTFMWIIIIPNIAAIPFFFVVWISNKMFARNDDHDF